MKASDIMTSPVIGVSPDTPVPDIAGLLSERRISGVPVLEGERLVGLVSEADLLRRRQLGRRARRARDIMTHEVETVAPDTPVEEIATVLEQRGIKRVPVLQAGRVVGIVTRSNLVQALAVRAMPEAAHPEDDEAIRSQLLAWLEGNPWWRRAESNVVVDDGVVHYWGKIHSEEEGAAARVAAQRIRGVRRVEDHRLETRKRPADDYGPQIRRASERGQSKQGWVDSYHSFSFGNFYDPAYMGYGPLRAINDKFVQPAKGSTTYGLCDVEIITYVLDGALGHDNSLDDSTVLSAGDVQCMSAGSGVRFSEANRDPSEVTHYLQIWIEPDSIGQPASYAHQHFPSESKRGRLRAIASSDAREDSLRMRQDAVSHAGLFDGAERAELDVVSERLVYVHVARGTITVQGRELAAGDGLAMAGGKIVLEHGRDAEVLVLDLPENPGERITARIHNGIA
jgi:redox-sensitive bicupin YhaK (pirin superfamily)/CBS domain-containing protein